ncbi:MULTISPECIES: sensor histidine kinase [Thermocrispum]|uniref:histidine kinase n=1 Tax=Thermocrispum agreste TaxID=37925 RepID=A0ABD6FEU1_9PSEU|nr:MULTISPECIES: sensor histidine kinase [Thermocrispum]
MHSDDAPTTPLRTSGRSSRWAGVQAAWRRLGLYGALLAAAVLADVVAAIADLLRAGELDLYPYYSRWQTLAMLPGGLLLAACAVLARRNAMLGAVLGSASLIVASPIAVYRVSGYTSLLAGISLAETVAGVLLVVIAHQQLPVPKAVAATTMLVVSCLAALLLRERGDLYAETFIFGFILLVGAVVYGHRTASGKTSLTPERNSRFAPYLAQWPLIGVLAVFVFLAVLRSTQTWIGLFGLVVSVVSAWLAVLSVRHAITAGLAMSGLFVLTAVTGGALAFDFPGLAGTPIPAVQVLAGFVVTVNLVRYQTPERATGVIAVMSVAVALATAMRTGGTQLRELALSALFALGLAVAIGLYLRSRDTARAQMVSAAVAEAKSAERMALARELHDVVAHHVTGIVVQAQAAKMVAKDDPKLTQEAFDRIEAAGIEAMTAMRRLVASIRSGQPSDTPPEDATMDLAADLRKLVDSGSHGVPTELRVDIGTALPQEVARSALRIVQEALTNVGKHAEGATKAQVVVGVVDGQLGIRVSDNGRGSSSAAASRSWRDSGYGLVGMRERVELLHGRLSVGPAPGGGWVVEAWLPLNVEDTRT